MSMRSAVAAAKRGAKHLDKVLGSRSWRRKIHRRELELASPNQCILGQLRPHYANLYEESFDSRWGFDTDYRFDYDELNEAWKKVLRA